MVSRAGILSALHRLVGNVTSHIFLSRVWSDTPLLSHDSSDRGDCGKMGGETRLWVGLGVTRGRGATFLSSFRCSDLHMLGIVRGSGSPPLEIYPSALGLDKDDAARP